VQLLVTTFDALLRVRLRENAPPDVHVLEQGLGVYYGLTRAGRTTHIASRNLDPDRQPLDPAEPANAIEDWDLPATRRLRRWADPRFDDLHQIRAKEDLLFVLTGVSPHLLVCDRRTHAVLAEIDLNAHVPADLRHEPVERHAGDTYHFNSLTFFADRLLVLAHNWSFGGFALEFRLDGPAARAGRLELTNAYRGLGFESHDVFMDRSGVYALDSGQNRLVHADHPSLSLGPLRFPRGLAATPAQFVIGAGERGVDRETRQATRTTLLIVDRAAWQVAAQYDLGAHGRPARPHPTPKARPSADAPSAASPPA
jgi:hypothetical protein